MNKDVICILSTRQEDTQAWLSLGAQVSLQVVYEATPSPELLRRTLTGAVTWQKRNETTVEKAILSPSQAPQWVGALLALGGRVAIRQEQQEEPLPDFMRRKEAHRRKLAAVHLPLNVTGCVWGESHVARTPADEPIVAVIFKGKGFYVTDNRKASSATSLPMDTKESETPKVGETTGESGNVAEPGQ